MSDVWKLLFEPIPYTGSGVPADTTPALIVIFWILLVFTLLCFALLALYVPVFVTASSLHINLKVLLLLSLASHFVVLVSHIHFYIGGLVYLPTPDYETYVEAKAASRGVMDFTHEFGYGLSSFFAFWLVVERYYASRQPDKYERMTRPDWCFLAVASAVTISISFAISFILHYYSLFLFGGVLIVLVDDVTIVLAIVSYYHFKRKYAALLGKATLNSRYQMFEIVEYSRAILPACLTAACIRAVGGIPIYYWIRADVNRFYLRTSFFPLHALSCVAMKKILIDAHRGLRRTVESTYGPKIRRVLMTSEFRRRTSITEENVSPDAHFEMLHNSWEEGKRN